MNVSCSICRDEFSLETHVCSLQCGHLFHEICINKWLETSPTCPQCRRRLWEPPVRIHFEVRLKPEETFRDPECEQLLLEMQALLEEVKELRLKNEDLSQKLCELQRQESEAKKKLRRRKVALTVYEREYGYAKERYDRFVSLQKENELMETQIRCCSRLRTFIHGSEADMKKTFDELPITLSTIEDLWTCEKAMKQQLKLKREYYNNKITELKNDIERKENMQYADNATEAEDMPIKKTKSNWKKKYRQMQLENEKYLNKIREEQDRKFENLKLSSEELALLEELKF